MSQPDKPQFKSKTYRLWQDVEAKLKIKAEAEGMVPSKMLNVLMSQVLKDVPLPPKETEQPLPDIASHDAF